MTDHRSRIPVIYPAFLSLLFLCPRLVAAPEGAEAALLIIGDQHSAYERTAQFTTLVDTLKSEAPELPLAMLINGDVFEQGNPVARRTSGEIDYAMLAALSKRAPTVLNLGNHEPEFSSLAETVQRATASGARVISNINNPTTGQAFAPDSLQLQIGKNQIVIVGLATDHLNTYRTEARPILSIPEPTAWARENFPRLLAGTDQKTVFPVILSHCGVAVDKNLLPLVPDGTLFSGAHDHLLFVEPMGHTVYFHSGSWNEYATVAWLIRNPDGTAHWQVEQRKINNQGPIDNKLSSLIHQVREANLTPEDRQIIGHLPDDPFIKASKPPLAMSTAAQWTAALMRVAAGTDAAFIGNTTFGAGLPAGGITREEFDACVRFDNTICKATVTGARLKDLLADANQGPQTPFAQRHGEFLFADGPREIDPEKTYTIATTDWCAKNTARYFGEPAISWKEIPGLKTKAVVRSALTEASQPKK